MNNINFTDIYLQTQAAGLAERNEQRRRQLEANGADVPAPRRTVRAESKLPPAMGGGTMATQLVSRVPVASK